MHTWLNALLKANWWPHHPDSLGRPFRGLACLSPCRYCLSFLPSPCRVIVSELRSSCSHLHILSILLISANHCKWYAFFLRLLVMSVHFPCGTKNLSIRFRVILIWNGRTSIILLSVFCCNYSPTCLSLQLFFNLPAFKPRITLVFKSIEFWKAVDI